MDILRELLQRPIRGLSLLTVFRVSSTRSRSRQIGTDSTVSGEDIVSVNQNLPAQRAARSGVISKPAETVLLKRLRQLGFDPSALDVSHIGSGGGLYLLELFVTAAQQEALSDTALLTALLDEADSLGSMSKEAAMSRRHASACPDGLPVG